MGVERGPWSKVEESVQVLEALMNTKVIDRSTDATPRYVQMLSQIVCITSALAGIFNGSPHFYGDPSYCTNRRGDRVETETITIPLTGLCATQQRKSRVVTLL
jgi:hypothetical protein